MKALILAGGHGSRMGESSQLLPKPMVDLCGRPILWHIMNHYVSNGIQESVVLGGHLVSKITDYFSDPSNCPCHVTVLDTGLGTNTGGRVKAALEALNLDSPFHLTYGDGLSDVSVAAVEAKRNLMGCLAAVTGVHPPHRFGHLQPRTDGSVRVREHQDVSDVWVNGGFMALSPQIAPFIHGPSDSLEAALERASSLHLVTMYAHDGFWKCIDNPRDLREMEQIMKGSDQ